MRKLILAFIFFLFLCSACKKEHNIERLNTYFENSIAKFNRQLTDVIVADIFTPPVASRIYAYPNIAAYESLRFLDEKQLSLVGQLNDLENLSTPDKDKKYFFPLASIVAFTNVAKSLVYDLERIEQQQQEMLDEVKAIGIDPIIFENSVDFGNTIAQEILAWAHKDGYLRRTALPRYSVNDDPSRWRPTPPDYHEAIEPHWNTLRPFVLDSVNQFDPGAPTPFDISKKSKFYQEVEAVYTTVKNLNEEQLEIAKFWDCNPNISHTKGHVMYFQQQISPGGHWIHITAQVLEAQKEKPLKGAETMAQVSMAIADAFISCWDQKYKSNLTRPETVINKYIDSDWNPILQTPAFPEHTSGHSVASTAAATILTHIYGDSFEFIDSTEVPYGLPERKFSSFTEASQEAAISRLYGGIHYQPAIELGKKQGKAVGAHLLKNIKTKK